jgi:hypothetical protein
MQEYSVVSRLPLERVMTEKPRKQLSKNFIRLFWDEEKRICKNKCKIRVLREISHRLSIFKDTFENFQTSSKIHTTIFTANR